MKIIYKSDDGKEFETIEEVTKYEQLTKIYIVYYQHYNAFDKSIKRIFSSNESAQKYVDENNPVKESEYRNRYSIKEERVYE